MSAHHTTVTDSFGSGLVIHSAPDVSCWRHNVFDSRCTGIWEVSFIASMAAAAVIGAMRINRPAVVDDFGSLVFVGEPL